MSTILDRQQYDPKMITNIEVMSAYFVDLYYNHLYFEGKKLKVNGSVSSITEGYKHALNAFIKSLGNSKLYKKAIIGIHQYFINYTSFTTISFAKCVDRLTANFVPQDYYNSLNNTQKMSVLRLVINQAIKSFTRKIVNEHLTKIIDNHKDIDNVRLLQDELIDCFLLEREGVYQRFVSTQTQTNTDETVNRLLSEKMQKEIKKLILEKIQLKHENSVLKQIIVKNNKETAQHVENIGTLESTIEELNEIIRKNEKEKSTNFEHPNTYLFNHKQNEFSHREPDKKSNFQIEYNKIKLDKPLNEPSSSKKLSETRKTNIYKNPSPTNTVKIEEVRYENESSIEEVTQVDENNDLDDNFIQSDYVNDDPEFIEITSKNLDNVFQNIPNIKPDEKKTPIPKKKKIPSADLGEGITLDDFY